MNSNRNSAMVLVATIALLFFSGAVFVMAADDTLALPTTKPTTAQVQGLYVSFIQEYKKTYEPSELFNRLSIFTDNINWMIDWNNDKTHTHQVGINFFADLAQDEWSQYTGLIPPKDWVEPDYAKFDKMADADNVALQEVYATHPHLKTDPPADLNWNLDEYDNDGKLVHKAALLPIRDQLTCGSCYSYSAMAAVEGLYRINFNDEKDPFDYFSVQQGLDCTGPKWGCQYCSGGFMMPVMAYIIANNGVCLEKDYPYKNRRTACAEKKCTPAFTFHKYVDVSGQTGATLTKHIAVNPLAIGVASSSREFMYYKSGVITRCGSGALNHAVNAIGYSNSGDIPHMIGRNSWSSGWGDNGAFRIALAGNVCQWRANVSYPWFEPGPKEPQTPALA